MSSSLVVEQLRTLVDFVISSEYTDYVWKRMHDRDTQQASNWLLDHQTQLRTLEEAWRTERKEHRTLASRHEDASPPLSAAPPKPYQPLEITTSKIRYLDDQVISTKGERYVLQDKNKKPEWDGGSRGKVKTKGKRGKGFV